jgi:hypothetical protein
MVAVVMQQGRILESAWRALQSNKTSVMAARGKAQRPVSRFMVLARRANRFEAGDRCRCRKAT